MNAERLDARGLRCPLPSLKAQKRLRGLAPGAMLRLEADDPMAEVDIPHLCAQQGHELVAQGRAAEGLWFLIRRGAQGGSS